MAERRMFAKTIIDSDAFLDMPQSSQLLYFHLSMRADDDGFINNPKSIMRNVKCNDDDLKLLSAKRFIIPFESGIVVIKHWKVHNYIAKDRYHETKYKKEKAQLELDENKAYTKGKSDVYTDCIQPVYEMDTQVRLGKVSLGKDSKDICPELPATPDRNPEITMILNDKSDYPIYKDKVDEWIELFPAVDVMQELRKMKAWLNDNPSRRKTKRGILRFCSSWLSREQDKGGTYRNGGDKVDTGSKAKGAEREKTWSEEAREIAEQYTGGFEGF